MSKKRANKFPHRKHTIPAVITAAAFAATLTAPASALTPAASSASQVEQAATSSSASSSSSASQTSSETSSVISSSSASSSAASGSTTSSRTSSAVSAPSSENQMPVQAGSSSTSSATSSQAPQTPAPASGAPKLKDSSSDFTIVNGVLTKYNGAGGVVTIPSSVTSIGNWAFADCTSLMSVTIPSSVTSIGESAFENCTSLTSVTIPFGVTSIGDGAFGVCFSLSSVTIPSSVTTIGEDAFTDCTGLTSVTIPSSVTSIGENAFGDCTGLTNITVSDQSTTFISANGVLFDKAQKTLIQYPAGKQGGYSISSSVTSIGGGAFGGCSGLSSVTIPSSVTNIGKDAFSDTNLTSVSIPSSVTSIGNSAFSDTRLTSVIIPSSVTNIGEDAFAGCADLSDITVSDQSTAYSSANGVLFDKAQKTLIQYPAVKQGGYFIPSSVISIGENAFGSCTGLTSVVIPSSVTGIGDGAFGSCTGLTSVVIPSSVTSIGDYAFSDTNLTSVTIPSSVISIGNETFFGDGNLTVTVDPGSYAETYAQQNNIKYVLSNSSTITIGQYDGTDPTNKPITVTATTDAMFNTATGEMVSADGHTASYTFSQNGSFTFTATDAAGNMTSKTVTISNIDTTPPTITVGQYDGTDPTNKPITVTATTGSDATFSAATGETVSADGHTASYTFSQNGSFTFTATDAAGNMTSKTVTISNIDTTPPTITVGQYDGTDPTNKPIMVTATTGSDATFSAATGETVSADGHTASYTFSQNGSFTFTATDAAGNMTSKTVTISNIDTTPPTITVGQYDGTDPTNKPITVTATTGSDATFSAATGETVSADGHTASYTFSKNGSFTFMATDAAGNTTSQTVTISNIMQNSNAKPLTDIDTPADDSTVSGTVNVSGWVLNASGINRVDIYAYDSNGTAHSIGSVASKDLTDRTDVANAFANGDYGNINNSGYTLPVDTTKLASGTYTLAVAGIGNDGVVQWATKTINVTTPQPLTDIDSPSNGATVNGTMSVSGWVLNASGINRVDIYAFDSNGKAHSLGSVASKDLTNRTDVASAFANDGYGNINNSGYTLPVDTTQLAGGTYTLAVAGIGNNGVVQWATKSINVTTPQPLTDIDSPTDGSTVSGTVNVSGWVLNASGINRVDIYAFDSDGKAHSLGSVASKDLTDRTDVANAFANDGYGNINNSGYTLPVDTTQLAGGTYTLAVAGIGNNGVVQWATKSINVTTPQPLTDIDSPTNGSTVSGTVNVSGWALNVSGIDRVDVYAWDSNGQPHSLGSVASKDLTDRTDVASAFASDGYGNINNSGYTLPVDTTKLASGTYTLAVAGIGNNGAVQWVTKSITVQ